METRKKYNTGIILLRQGIIPQGQRYYTYRNKKEIKSDII